ncbi:MAG: mechanosensitive ion channel family protein [Dehalococcoidia bacterium]|nr:mechanosensitive ion channel family protein [Dehalococcoidia bacterium]
MFRELQVLNIIIAVAIFAIAVILSLTTIYFSRMLKRRIASNSHAKQLSKTFDRMARALIALFVIDGILLALMSLAVNGSALYSSLAIICAVIAVVVITEVIIRNIGAFFTWHLTRTQERTRKHVNTGAALFLKRILQILICAVSLICILSILGISISPLIASLGIGGLAVALAVQPTLENFFAGMQIVSDNAVHVGDFIELNADMRGYVIDVGWRSTKIRTPTNNILVAPNSSLAHSQLVNYNQPNHAVNIFIRCGVSYENDLNHISAIALEVVSDIRNRMDEAVKNFEPRVVFDEFGESNIILLVALQAKDRLSGISLKNELIMRLHQRFREENVKINYPLRLTHPL